MHKVTAALAAKYNTQNTGQALRRAVVNNTNSAEFAQVVEFIWG